METRDLIRSAEQGQYRPVYVIAGGERFFVDRAVAALRRATVNDGDAWNEETFQGKGLNATQVIEAARTLPMMAQVRFVLVRNVDQLAGPEQDKLAAYVTDPVDSACLVLMADKLDGRGKLAKAAKAAGVLVEATPLRQADLRSFVTTEAKGRQLRLDGDAAAALIDAIGNDLPAIDDALERLSLYVGDSAHVDLRAVEACVSRLRVESIWALVDAVGQRNQRVAMHAASSLLADREPPLRILAMVARQLRIVARVSDILAAGGTPADAAKAAGAPPFKAGELASAARRFDPAKLGHAFSVLAETDLALKGSRRPAETVLEAAILELTQR